MAATELEKTILKDDSNLKAYWRFEETSGTTLYDIKGSNHMTTTNSGILTPSGKFGRGLFTGTSAYSGNITYAGNDLKPTGPFSLAWWMKTSDTGTYNMTFGTASWQNPTDTGFWIDYRNGSIGLHTADNSTNTSYGAIGSGLNNGEWRHIVCVFTGITANNYMKLYVDGAYVGQIQFSRAIAFSSTSIFHFGEGMVNTYLDDAGFFSTALSADQIKELYEGRNLGELRPQTGLVGLWHLNGSSTDFSGNNNHGTDTAITYSQANGKFGQGAGFNGSSSKIIASLAGQSGAVFTYCGYFKSSSATAQAITSHYQNSNNYSDIELNANGTLRYFAWNGTTIGAITTTGTYSDGVRHFFCVVRNGASVSIYVDGNLAASGSSNNITLTTGFELGRDSQNNVNFFNGSLDEVAVFNVAKSASWVRQQYSLGRFGEI